MARTQHPAFKFEYSGIVTSLITPVGVAVAQITSQSEKQNIVQAKALWDTGATNSVIIPKLAKHLGLKPIGKTIVKGVNSIEEANVFLVDLLLPNSVLCRNISITESEFIGADILIGMNIIQLGDFAIANAKGKTHFSFCVPPHDRPVCLYEKSLNVDKKIRK